MISEGFCDAMFDPSYDSISTDFYLYDSWPTNTVDGFSTMTAEQPYQMNTWKNKHISSWTSNEILHWMCNEASSNNRNYEDLKLHNFANVSTNAFQSMSLDDFVNLSESYDDGQFLFRSKENLVRYQPPVNYVPNRTETHQVLQDCPEQRPSRLSCSSTESSASEQPARRGPGRPKSSHTIRRKPLEKRTGKLWEFLRNLLFDDKTCPSLIKWDNHREGTFKFVQSEKVAKLWGDRKKNDKMNYEKLSRAMRYYYRSRVLQPVAGKRLVYKFGPAATGWETENPILEQRCELQA